MVAPSSTPVFTSERMRSSCTGATIAPMSIALSSGGPTRSFSMRALSFVTSRSAIPSCTSSREPAQHTWPWLNQIASTTPSTTLSRSASSNTMNGLCPPSASDSFLPDPAVALRMMRPTSVEPVNAILSMSGWFTINSPVRPSPVTTLSTPAGSPASCAISARHSAVSGVNSAGFSTTVFPAASAGAIFHATMSRGKFQGTICPTTPTGPYPANSDSASCAQPAWCVRWRATSGMSKSRVSRIDLPLSRLSSTASSRECFWTARARAYKWRARAWPDSADQEGNAWRAAATAASTSAWPAWVTRASRAVVAGLMTSNPASLVPLVQRPPMKSPNAPSCRAIHSSAGLSLSGAGPYAIVSKISLTVVTATPCGLRLGACGWRSYHRMVVCRRVPPGHEVLELALDVGEERRRAEPEQSGPQPPVAELFLHQDEPVERLLRLADPARWLDADGVSGALVVVADLPRHDHADGEGRIHGFFAGGRLDEIGAGHHGDLAGARHVHERRQVAGAEDHLHVGAAAGLPEGADFVVQGLPGSGQRVRARDHDVDLLRPRGDRRLDLLDPLGQGVQPRRESRRDGGHGDPGALQCLDSDGDAGVVDAYRAHGDPDPGGSEGGEQVGPHGTLRLGAQAEHVGRSVVALERGQVHAGDRAQEPRGLPFFLDGASRRDRSGAALHRAAIHAQRPHQVEVERRARIPAGSGDDAQHPLG